MLRFPLALLVSAATLLAQPPADLEAVVETDLGTFRFEFAPDKAPKHVEQFIARARQGYYDGSAFHRVIANGLIQGGDPLLKNAKTAKTLWGTGGLSLIASEFNDIKHDRGVISTVSIPGRANSEGAQFFVCVSLQAPLDGKFTAFGRITEGIDVVEKISRVPADASGLTDKAVKILKLSIEKRREEPFIKASVDELRRTVSLNTSLGIIKLKMEPDWAPGHVRKFLMLAQTGWYNGTPFHRISTGFVVQGGIGAYRSSGPDHPSDRWVAPLKAEFRDDVKHVRGTVSMAHFDDPDSATTSFFLMLGPSPGLDGKFTAFARVVEGLNVLDAFEKEEVEGEKPKRMLEIVSAVIDAN